MQSKKGRAKGFTVVEILIIIVVIGILVTIGVVVYHNVAKKSAEATMLSTLKQAVKVVESETMRSGTIPDVLPDSVKKQETGDITLELVPMNGVRYKNLSAVQNAVLFDSVCRELIPEPQYSVIHAREGGGSMTVMTACHVNGTRVQYTLTSWDTKHWTVPVSREQIDDYIDSVPYDSWWIDRQEVVRGFYQQLVYRFESRGGTWPITTFWDISANQWSGVHREELPPPTLSGGPRDYCLIARHKHYPDMLYAVRNSDSVPHAGDC